MEATRASASPRSRDTKAGPNPPDVWHSRELHDGESQAAGNSGEPLALRPKSLVRQKVGQEVELHGRSPSPDRSYSNSASSLRSHFSQPRGPVPLDRSRVPALNARTRRPGHDGTCSSATPRTKQLRAADTKTGLQIPPRPRPEPPIRPAGQPAGTRRGDAPHLPWPPTLLPRSRRHPRHRGGERSASCSSASWAARCRLHLGAQRGSADGAALSTRSSVRRAAERRVSG